MDYRNVEPESVTLTYSEEVQQRHKEDTIPLLIGGSIEIDYFAFEEEKSRWDDNDHNGPQAA